MLEVVLQLQKKSNLLHHMLETVLARCETEILTQKLSITAAEQKNSNKDRDFIESNFSTNAFL